MKFYQCVTVVALLAALCSASWASTGSSPTAKKKKDIPVSPPLPQSPSSPAEKTNSNNNSPLSTSHPQSPPNAPTKPKPQSVLAEQKSSREREEALLLIKQLRGAVKSKDVIIQNLSSQLESLKQNNAALKAQLEERAQRERILNYSKFVFVNSSPCHFMRSALASGNGNISSQHLATEPCKHYYNMFWASKLICASLMTPLYLTSEKAYYWNYQHGSKHFCPIKNAIKLYSKLFTKDNLKNTVKLIVGNMIMALETMHQLTLFHNQVSLDKIYFRSWTDKAADGTNLEMFTVMLKCTDGVFETPQRQDESFDLYMLDDREKMLECIIEVILMGLDEKANPETITSIKNYLSLEPTKFPVGFGDATRNIIDEFRECFRAFFITQLSTGDLLFKEPLRSQMVDGPKLLPCAIVPTN